MGDPHAGVDLSFQNATRPPSRIVHLAEASSAVARANRWFAQLEDKVRKVAGFDRLCPVPLIEG